MEAQSALQTCVGRVKTETQPPAQEVRTGSRRGGRLPPQTTYLAPGRTLARPGCTARLRPGTSPPEPPLAPPPRLSFPTNHKPGGPPATWASCHYSGVSTSQQPPPAALASGLRRGRVPWRACALRGKPSKNPPRSVAPLRRACEGRRGRCHSSCPW